MVGFDALIDALRAIATPVCERAADRLAALPAAALGYDLHLRNAALTVDGARILAHGIATLESKALRSFSASYNPDLGDDGAAALAAVFPASLTELGLVGCTVGDDGGRALLTWAHSATDLRMICVEGNAFSGDMKDRIKALKIQGMHPLVIV